MLKSYVRAIRWLYDPANRTRAIAILTARTRTAPNDASRTSDELVTKFYSFQPDARNSTKGVDVVLGRPGHHQAAAAARGALLRRPVRGSGELAGGAEG